MVYIYLYIYIYIYIYKLYITFSNAAWNIIMFSASFINDVILFEIPNINKIFVMLFICV